MLYLVLDAQCIIVGLGAARHARLTRTCNDKQEAWGKFCGKVVVLVSCTSVTRVRFRFHVVVQSKFHMSEKFVQFDPTKHRRLSPGTLVSSDSTSAPMGGGGWPLLDVWRGKA